MKSDEWEDAEGIIVFKVYQISVLPNQSAFITYLDSIMPIDLLLLLDLRSVPLFELLPAIEHPSSRWLSDYLEFNSFNRKTVKSVNELKLQETVSTLIDDRL